MTLISPQTIYLTTEAPDPTTTTATGDGLIKAVISRMETFTVYMRDRYKNSFDVLNDKLHKGIPSKNDFLIPELITVDSVLKNRTTPVIQLAADYFNGVFIYVYTILEPHDGPAYLSVKTLNTYEAIL